MVILDEPYNGVDLEGNEIIKHIIKTNNRTKTVILSSHILSTITEVCDSIYHMSESSQIQQYPKSDFQTLSTVLELNMLNKLSELDEYS